MPGTPNSSHTARLPSPSRWSTSSCRSGRRRGSPATLSKIVVPTAAPLGRRRRFDHEQEAEAGVAEVDRRAVLERPERRRRTRPSGLAMPIEGDARPEHEGDQVGGREAAVAVDVGAGARRRPRGRTVAPPPRRDRRRRPTPSQLASRNDLAPRPVVSQRAVTPGAMTERGRAHLVQGTRLERCRASAERCDDRARGAPRCGRRAAPGARAAASRPPRRSASGVTRPDRRRR